MVNNINTHHVATQLVRQFHRAALAHDMAEAAGDETAARVHSDRIDALANEVSFHPAGTPEAALYLAQILRADLDIIRSEGMSYEDAASLRRAERLATTLVQWIEQTSGIDRDDYRLGWYSSHECDGMAFGEIAPCFVVAA